MTTNLGDTLPFLHHRAGTRGGALVGFSQPGGETVTLDSYDPALDNGNITCLGISGSGKTMFAQSFALKQIARGGRVIVLDRSTGHWDDLVAAVPGAGSHGVRLDSGFRFNPWELPRGVAEPNGTKLEYLLDLHTLLLGEPHGGVPTLTVGERALLEGAIRAVYRETLDPQESDLYEWLLHAEAWVRDEMGDAVRGRQRWMNERERNREVRGTTTSDEEGHTMLPRRMISIGCLVLTLLGGMITTVTVGPTLRARIQRGLCIAELAAAYPPVQLDESNCCVHYNRCTWAPRERCMVCSGHRCTHMVWAICRSALAVVHTAHASARTAPHAR